MPGSRLINRNVIAGRGRTSMRLEPELWDALAEICVRERRTMTYLVRRIEAAGHSGGRTSAVRVFVLQYFRAAASEAGHEAANHGPLDRVPFNHLTRHAAWEVDIPKLQPEHSIAPVLLLGKTIRLLPIPDGELARSGQPSDPTAAQRYLANAFGDHLDKAPRAINELASRYEPAELNRIGFSLYEKFRPAVPYGTEGWGKRAVLDMEMGMPRAATSSGQ